MNFYPNTTNLPCDKLLKGKRRDGLSLAELWLSKQREKGRSAEFARAADELYAKASTKPDYLLGERLLV